jgi:hypothetical protein
MGLPTGHRTVAQPAEAKPVPDQATWLSTKNRAAQRVLSEMGMIKETAPEAAMTASARATAGQTPQVARGAPQLTPRHRGLQTAVPSPQMLLLSGDGVAYAAMDISQAKHFYERPQIEEPWSLGADLDKYREHAVREGSRDFGQSLGRALERIGLAVEDTTNVITLGYASDRGMVFRGNDGKGLLDDPGRVPMQAGETVVSLGDGLYSLADLITLDSLPNHDKSVYSDNHPIVRPLVFTGRTIGGVWKTTEEIGNAITWGYWDNFTGTIGMCIEDIIEVLKHTGQAVTNLARIPVQLISGNDPGTDKALDWVLLVPLEFVSNVVEMKGVANTQDYENAFAEKGVIGSLLEFGGSTYIVYRAVDELVEELEDDGHKRRQTSEASDSPAPEPEVPVIEEPTPTWTGTNYFWWWDENGQWVRQTD